MARWCRPNHLGSRCPIDRLVCRRWLVLVLAARAARIQWHRTMQLLQFLEQEMQPTHLYVREDGDCGQRLSSFAPVSLSNVFLLSRAKDC